MKGDGFQENCVVDEGVNAVGVRTRLHFEGDSLIVQRTFDAEPYLAHVQAMRERNAGRAWGEGVEVGYIPPVYHAQIAAIRDPQGRKRALKQFFRDNPAFCAYAPYLKR